MREINSAWPTLCCHIIVLAYENKFNLEAAYGNVYARRAQTAVSLCVCVCGGMCVLLSVARGRWRDEAKRS